MDVKLHAFPAVYLNAICAKHNCLVTVVIESSTTFQSDKVVGAQITSVACHTGGVASSAECTNDWKIVTSSIGPITIS